MTHTIIFATSGSLMTLLLAAKAWELRRRKQVFLLEAISYGDSYVKKVYHDLLRAYTEGKDNLQFFTRKQLPIHSKNILNKSIVYLEGKRNQYIGDVRDSRLLKKSDGISEFIKSM